MANENPDTPAAKPDGAAVQSNDKSPADAKPADAKPADAKPTDAKPTVAAPAKPNIPPQHPDEPVFQLKLNPDQFIAFKSDKLLSGSVSTDVSLTNTTKVRQVYKIKCTSNEIFRVRPPVAFVKPDETVVIKFTLSCKSVPDFSKHFFAFYHMAAPDANDKKPAKQFWTPTSKPEGIRRVPVKAIKEDDSPWNPEPASPAAPPVAPPAAPAEEKK